MAIVAIDENFSKLQRTHDMAKELAQLCKEKGIILEHPVDTNFVFVDIAANKINPDKLIEISDKYGVKIYSEEFLSITKFLKIHLKMPKSDCGSI